MLIAAPAAAGVLLVRGAPAWLYLGLAPRHACYFAVELRATLASSVLALLRYSPAWWLAAKLSVVWSMSCVREQPGIYKMVFKRKGGWMHIRGRWPYYLTMKFGYSHPVRYIHSQLALLRHKRYLAYHMLLLIGLPRDAACVVGGLLRGVRAFNPYTKRGIRHGRQLTVLRKGKESQYTKLKSKIF